MNKHHFGPDNCSNAANSLHFFGYAASVDYASKSRLSFEPGDEAKDDYIEPSTDSLVLLGQYFGSWLEVPGSCLEYQLAPCACHLRIHFSLSSLSCLFQMNFQQRATENCIIELRMKKALPFPIRNLREWPIRATHMSVNDTTNILLNSIAVDFLNSSKSSLSLILSVK